MPLPPHPPMFRLRFFPSLDEKIIDKRIKKLGFLNLKIVGGKFRKIYERVLTNRNISVKNQEHMQLKPVAEKRNLKWHKKARYT